MPVEVRFHPAAGEQLDALYDYIAERSGAAVAIGYLRRIRKRVQMLGDFPLTGRAANDLGPGLRMIVIERRVSVVYRVVPHCAEILGIYYGGRNLAALIGPDFSE